MKKIVLLGDSIREGYDKYVKHAFCGIAEVYYPKENCRFASYILRHLPDWKRDFDCGDDVDLVHWNAGLWDDLVMADGKKHTSIELYGEYIQRVCDVIRLLFPRAKVIFATSTPVREELFLGLMKRYNSDTREYNAIAVKTVKKNGAEINDLYAAVEGCPDEYYSDSTHLYTPGGTRLLAERVVDAIEGALNIKARDVDFEELFLNPNSVTGI